MSPKKRDKILKTMEKVFSRGQAGDVQLGLLRDIYILVGEHGNTPIETIAESVKKRIDTSVEEDV